MNKQDKPAKIHILDTLTTNMIAAGEVADRPAYIVKELIENSIDAGATRIEVRILDAKCEKIQITDNGCGMTPEDMRMSIIRHATSKISRAEDLNQLHTLGFRGEALPSIAAVSVMTMISKTPDSDVGYKMTVENGKASLPEEVAAQNGTLIVIDRLFYNTPARKKFLRSVHTELAAIAEVVTNMALSRLDIAFTLRRGNSRSIATSGQGNLQKTIFELFGREAAKNMLQVDLQDAEHDIHVYGAISLPGYNRSTRQYRFFVNGRSVRSPVLVKAIEDGYYTAMPDTRYPIAYLFLQLPTHTIDVNIHPAKLDIKFDDPVLIRSLVTQGIQQALFKNNLIIPRVETAEEKSKNSRVAPTVEQLEWMDAPNAQPVFRERKRWGAEDFYRQLYAPQSHSYSQAEPPGTFWTDSVEAAPSAEPYPQQLEADGPAYVQEENPQRICYSRLHVLGQYLGTYIIAYGAEGLYLIDQHAAAERILYEKLADKAAEDKLADSSVLAMPIPLQLSAADTLKLEEHIVTIRDMGFVLARAENGTYSIREIPLWCNAMYAEKLLFMVIDYLQAFDGDASKSLQHIQAEALFLASCKRSIKANRRLTDQDIRCLLEDLDHCRIPTSCPHGRPIAIILTEAEIRRRFLRSSK